MGSDSRHGIGGRMVLLFTVMLLCAGSVLVIIAIVGIPQWVENQFGPPALDLAFKKKLQISLDLFFNGNEVLLNPNNAGARFSSTGPFVVEQGQTASDVAKNLSAKGWIRDTKTFLNYLEFKGLDRQIRAGEFDLHENMTGLEVAYALQNPTFGPIEMQVDAGMRMEEIAERLTTSLAIDMDRFIEIGKAPFSHGIQSGLPIESGVEGFLFPGVYEFERDVTETEIIQMMVNRFDQYVDAALRGSLNDRGLSLYEAVTLASIVEKEAMVVDEMTMIAGVFYNRLENQARLESDPTVQYALVTDYEMGEWWKRDLTKADLAVDSPYNTYVYAGLPRGPISNVSLGALLSVAYPAETDYYYFRAKCDSSGLHNFSLTYDEHLSYACDNE
ncbi:MAG: endolytic transglycosylase MltG [Anaerolineaceae bacterium]|nr:endolytic transglycosylase MltG [Anaerolineaceae bacterium]